MKHFSIKKIIFIVLIFFLFSLGYFYFFIINPQVKKPNIEKPRNTANIQQNIIYILNDIGAYKLHNIPLTENKPVILVIVNDFEYYFSVDNGEILLLTFRKEKNISPKYQPDIKIIIDKEILSDLSDFKKEQISELIKSGKIKIEVLADESTLSLKGYMGIYTELTKNQITGEVFFSEPYKEIYPSKYNNALALLFMLSFVLLIGLIIENF